MKKLILPLFFLLVVIQWLVPAQMIWKKEAIGSKGTAYKFRTAPIDPYNPFIGKYIVLNYNEPQIKIPTRELVKYEKEVYVTFKKDRQGFAEIDKVFNKIPSRTDYLKTFINYSEEINDGTLITIYYPFKRFYMEESKAPEAERLYGSINRDSTANVYAMVAIYNGDAAIKNVYVNDTAIADLVRNEQRLR